MKTLPKEYSLKMSLETKKVIEDLNEQKFLKLLKELKIEFNGNFTREEKISLIKDKGQNTIKKALKKIQ